jgi:two-component system NtrC family response regulator
VVVKIPSLAERHGDATLLSKHFLARFAREMNPQVKGFSPGRWRRSTPGRGRATSASSRNRVKRAVIMAEGKLVTLEDLDLPDREGAEPLPVNLKSAREAADRKAIRRALAETENNISGAAKLLGISRPTLYDLMKQYQLQP